MPKLLPTQISPCQDISQLVRKYISHQSDFEDPPFEFHESPVKRKTERSSSTVNKKVCLADWRVLFDRAGGNGLGIGRTGRKGKAGRMYGSDRKFDIGHYPQKTTQRQDKEADRKEIRFTPHKTSTSFRQSNIQSALMQNLYEQKYIQQRRIHTAKIKRHYQKNHSQRPKSINNISNRNINVELQEDNIEKQFKYHFQKPNFHDNDVAVERRNKTMTKIFTNNNNNNSNNVIFWPQKYENVKIKRKYIRKINDIIIEGLAQANVNDENRDNKGLRFYGAANQ